MAGIVGICGFGKKEIVEKMLKVISHRGREGKVITVTNNLTIGFIWHLSESNIVNNLVDEMVFLDSGDHIRKVEAKDQSGKLILSRDELGVAPLYYGYDNDGNFCFASEVKALKIATSDINLLLPGQIIDEGHISSQFHLKEMPKFKGNIDDLLKEIREKLGITVSACIKSESAGAWLSGGLDSSIISFNVNVHVHKLHTFVSGTMGAPDIEYAREMASFLKSEHHELIVNINDILASLPEVIYYLESFDYLLVRSSVLNYLTAKMASDYVSEIFSGEVGDELFAGYHYLKSLPLHMLDNELLDIIGRLHNTALQRVDRCSQAHGLIAHVPFADREIVNLALSIPSEYKIKDGVEKWILREAFKGMIPDKIINRTKAKFWEGGGIGNLIADYASKNISDHDFQKERILPNGWSLNSKEEFMYYQLFRDTFGKIENLEWMGRSK
jgi:asparagine synthase (glutamine-hydrolysing)